MPQVGQSLNHRYQLLQPLGENANQQTWLASDLAQPSVEKVVVKLLAMNPQMKWERAKLLEREAQILQQLNHPRIPQYRDYFLLEQLADSRFPWFCLVQSQVPGDSLQQLLDQGRRFTQAEVEKIAIEVLQILVYLHQLQPPVVHRDIKPGNLIWGVDDHLYLIDFGSVQDQAALEGVTFTIVGTYGYSPMEQFGGQAVPASDLYALGASLIHLLTGVAPAELPQRNARIQFANQVSLEPGLVNWVSQLSAPDLAERFPTARLALDALAHRETLSLPMVHRQPIGSRIRLKKSVNQLEINIPARGWQALSWLVLLGYGFAGVWMLVEIAHLVFDQTGDWGVLAVLAIWLTSITIAALVATKIIADRTHFTVYWKLFGIPVWKQRGQTARIHPRISIYEQQRWGARGIVIQAGKTILPTNPMAEVERQWLIQEIQDWLSPAQSRNPDERNVFLSFPGNQVEVTESSEELIIQYPGYEANIRLAAVPIAFQYILYYILLYASIRFLLQVSSPILCAVLPWYLIRYTPGIYTRCFPNTLCFNWDHFVLYKHLLGLKLELFRGSTGGIQRISQQTTRRSANISETRLVVIKENGKTHKFGLGLSKPERLWLIQAIKRWLRHLRHKT